MNAPRFVLALLASFAVLLSTPAVAQIDPAARGLAVGSRLALSRVRPANNRICVLGHSKMAQHHSGTANAQANGPLNWALMLNGQRATFDSASNYGYNGDFSSAATFNSVSYPGMLNRLPGILAADDCGTFVLKLFTNDRNMWTADQSIANGRAIVSLLRTAGRVIIFMTDDPRGDAVNTGNTLPAQQIAYAQRVNRWIMSLADLPGVYPVDTARVLADPTSGFGRAVTGVMYDGLHENSLGAYYEGMLLVPVLNYLFPPRPVLPFGQAEAVGVTGDNPGGVLNAQPYLGGTGGTFVGTGSSGTLAASWTNTDVSTAGLTAVYSKQSTTAFGGSSYIDRGELATKDWQQVVLSGTASNANETAVLRQFVTTGIAAGDVLGAVAEIEVDAGVTGVSGFYLRVTDGGYTSYARSMGVPTVANGTTWPNRPITGVQRIPRWVSPSTTLYIEVCVRTIPGATVAGTLRVRGVGISRGLAATVPTGFVR